MTAPIKEPLLLLPGMMCDARLFAPQLARFSASRAVMIAPLTGHDNFTDMAEDILSNAPPKFALAGLSMGGIAAMEIMRLAPNRVTRLALMDTNHLADTKERKDIRDTQIEQAGSGGLYTIMREEMKPNYLADGPGKNAILDLCMEMAQTLDLMFLSANPAPSKPGAIRRTPSRPSKCPRLFCAGKTTRSARCPATKPCML